MRTTGCVVFLLGFSSASRYGPEHVPGPSKDVVYEFFLNIYYVTELFTVAPGQIPVVYFVRISNNAIVRDIVYD